jgi:hypothetical protein
LVGFIALTPSSLQALAPSIAVAADRLEQVGDMLDRHISRREGGNHNVDRK